MQPGETISHYRVIDKLGHGGMGEVYRAVDTRLDRTVALKVISGGGGAQDRKRFEREAKAASALNHPNIVTVYEFGNSGDSDFIAMEFVEGTTLHQRLADGPIALADTLRFARQIASALGKAHDAGIVHRDLKPMNLMLTADGSVKVLDFGIARRTAATVTADAETALALTVAGAVTGTPGYMSPEQAKGEEVDQRSDIFSFGAVLYELITGLKAFQGKSTLEVLSAVAFKEPEPSATIRPSVPSDLHDLIAACMMKDRALRVQSMKDVAAALERVAQNLDLLTAQQTVQTLPPIAPPPAPGRRRIWIGLAAVAAAIGVIGYGVFRNRPQSDRPVATPRTAAEHYQLGLSYLKRHDRKGNVDGAIAAFQKAVQLDTDLAAAYAGLADAYATKNAGGPDPQWVRLARESGTEAVKRNPDLALAHASLGHALLAANEPESTVKALAKAIELDPRGAPAHHWLGVHHAAAGNKAEAEKELRVAMQLDPGDWKYPARLGEFLYKNARYEDALAAWRQALELTPDNGTVHRNAAAAEHMLGRYEEAANHLQKALETDPSDGVYNNLGTLRFFQGRYADAVSAFEKAVERRPSSYFYWANLADAYRWAPGQREKSKTPYARAIQLARTALQAKPDNAELRSRLGLYLAKNGEREEAKAELTKALAGTASAAMRFRATVGWELLGDRGRALDELAKAIAAGYAASEIENEPELTQLRGDRRYHVLIAGGQQKAAK